MPFVCGPVLKSSDSKAPKGDRFTKIRIPQPTVISYRFIVKWEKADAGVAFHLANGEKITLQVDYREFMAAFSDGKSYEVS